MKNNSSHCGALMRRLALSLVFTLALTLPSVVFAQNEDKGGAVEPDVVTISNPEVSELVYPRVIDVDLRDLPVVRSWEAGDPIKEIPRRITSRPEIKEKPEARVDPLLHLQGDSGYLGFTQSTPIINIAGQGYSGVNPPDTVGDVGVDYYIQSINGGGGALYTIYNKSDGSVAAGPFSMEALGSGSCASGLGDPIILYDQDAQRWMISEFSSSGNNLCVYISQTSDPISGGWYNYGFTASNFPDYPKYGVWTDAYYCGSNESSPILYAFDRANMLVGAAASFQKFTAPSLSGFGFQMITPADIDGATLPPAGSPGIFMRHKDDEVHSGAGPGAAGDALEIFEFDVDWNTPANSTLTGPIQVTISDFDSSLCGLTSFNCFPQPGTSTTLDPLREVVMFRLAYRNFGTHESLIGNLTTDVNGNDRGGIRWFELRKSGGSWGLHMEGTHSPDATNRFMGGIAMDGSGNIALAYNVSSSSVSPGLRYAGRLATDAAGTMPQGENIIVNGSGSNGSNRYGDYSSMSIDPVDDCTFWFTGQYNTSSQWSTRIASFSFTECGCDTPPGVPSISAANNGNNQVDISWSATSGATGYNVYRAEGSCPQGSYALIASVAGTSYSDTSVSGGITYAYVVTATSEGCESDNSNCADVTATGACTTAPTFAGVTGVTNLQQSGCALQVDWAAGSANCGSSLVYNVYRSTTSGFTPGPGNLEASCVAGTSYTDTNVNSGTTYYYVVRAEDNSGSGSGPCSGGNEDGNTVEASGAPTGPITTQFSDDMEGGTGNWTADSAQGSSPWSVVSTQANSGSQSWFVSDVGSVADQRLAMSSDVSIPAGSGATMSFYHWYNTESGFDGGILEASTNGGSSWSDAGGNITSNGPNGTISTSYSNPIGGSSAWTGNSGGFIETTVDLSAYEGGNVRFRWRLGCDSSVSGTGWWVDDVVISYGSDCGTGGCTYGISPSSANVAASGGTGSVSVTAGTGCAWTASSNDAWITVTSGASGSGNGSTGYSVAANTGAARSGTITIAGSTFTVNQAAGTVSWTTLSFTDFESGWGPYTDGGNDCRRSANDSSFAHQGTYCVRLRDDTGTPSSFFSTNNSNISAYSQLRISFWVFPVSMEGSEDFFLEYSSDGGSTWQVIGNWVNNVDFTNNNFLNPTVTINSGSYTFNNQAKIRFRCDASGNGDRLYFDEVLVEAQ